MIDRRSTTAHSVPSPHTYPDAELELEPPPSGSWTATVEPAVAEHEAGPLTVDWAFPLAGPLCLLALILGAGLLAMLAEAIDRAVPRSETPGELDPPQDPMAAYVERRESLGASANLGAQLCRVAATLVLLLLLAGLSSWTVIEAAALTLILGAPLLHLTTQTLPAALAGSRGDALLRAALPWFARLSVPMIPLVSFLRIIRRAILRGLRSSEADEGTRRMVEGFRAMVESAEFDGDLAAETRELIANAIEFGEVDAAEVMTPRTEIFAIEDDAALSDAVAVFARASFSRIPVYEGTIDTIIGTLTALEAAKAVAEGRLETTRIRDIMRPPLLVPETVRVPDLLNQFRADRQKMAIVVDEYGGTAGLVTLADVVAEIVGHVRDEYEEENTAFRKLEGGAVEADASLHVSDVNEALDLEIPEESDYETLGGFVLSEIGRFPSSGEAFTSNGVTFRVSEASDRRVLRVVLERPGGLELRREPGTPSTTTPRLASSSPGARSSKDGGLERRGA
jgi:CBS domain containing-hemolysin-like protein